MDAYFRNSDARNVLILVALVVMFAAIFARNFFFPEESALVFKQLIDTFVTTLVATVLVMYVLWIGTPKTIRELGRDALSDADLKKAFDEALKNANGWRFHGGCGRFFRIRVFSAACEGAKNLGTFTHIVGIIVNPNNAALCKAHADMRTASKATRRAKDEKDWTAERVRIEALATVAAAIKCNALFPQRITIDLHVADFFSTFRTDLSAEHAFQTRGDDLGVSFAARKGSGFYTALSQEFQSALAQSTKLDVGGGASHLPSTSHSWDLVSLKMALKRVGFENLTDRDLEEVLGLQESKQWR